MILNTLASSLRKQDWFTLLIELFVVITGLFLAFQVDRWWEERGNQALEADYINRLHEEVSTDIDQLRFAIELAEIRQDLTQFLADTVQNPDVARTQPARFAAAVIQSAYTYTPPLTRHSFDDLRSTGNMGLIDDDTLRLALYDYYDFDEGQRQYMTLNFMVEFRQFTLATGILDYDTHTALASEFYVVHPGNIAELGVLQMDPIAIDTAVQRFIDNKALTDWLPRVWGIQQEQINVHSMRLELAESLRDMLVSAGASPLHERAPTR